MPIAIRVTAVAALVVATLSERAPAQQVTVTGIVRDAISSSPLVGAIVTLGRAPDERATRTDANGTFVFDKVARGAYALSVRRLGYEPARSNVEVPASEPVVVMMRRVVALDTVRVSATDQGIYGAVGTSTDLRPLAASIQVIGTSGSRLRTDSTGHFFAPVKTPGPYLVRATADGFVGRTVSVTVRAKDGVEVALLLDSATGPADHKLEMAYGDFNSRMLQRGLASALVPGADLTRFGSDGTLVSSIVSSPSFAAKPLRFTSFACLFVDGQPKPGTPMNAYGPREVEMVELYGSKADRTRSLAQRWPRNAPCAATGMAPAGSGDDVVTWIVIWLKR